MGKRCVICQEAEAVLCAKGTSECYCEPCAKEHFGDTGLLTVIEDDARTLQQFIDDKTTASGEDAESGAPDTDTKDDVSDDALIDVKIKPSSKKMKTKPSSKKKKSEDND